MLQFLIVLWLIGMIFISELFVLTQFLLIFNHLNLSLNLSCLSQFFSLNWGNHKIVKILWPVIISLDDLLIRSFMLIEVILKFYQMKGLKILFYEVKLFLQKYLCVLYIGQIMVNIFYFFQIKCFNKKYKLTFFELNFLSKFDHK